MVSSELLIVVLLFIALDGLEVGPEWKKFAENLKTKAQKLYLCLGPILEKTPINSPAQGMEDYPQWSFIGSLTPPRKRKCFQPLFHIIISICPLEHVCFLWLQYIQSYFKQW